MNRSLLIALASLLFAGILLAVWAKHSGASSGENSPPDTEGWDGYDLYDPFGWDILNA